MCACRACRFGRSRLSGAARWPPRGTAMASHVPHNVPEGCASSPLGRRSCVLRGTCVRVEGAGGGLSASMLPSLLSLSLASPFTHLSTRLPSRFSSPPLSRLPSRLRSLPSSPHVSPPRDPEQLAPYRLSDRSYEQRQRIHTHRQPLLVVGRAEESAWEDSVCGGVGHSIRIEEKAIFFPRNAREYLQVCRVCSCGGNGQTD